MYKLIKRGTDFNAPIKFYLCDTLSERDGLTETCAPGTCCYVISECQRYMLNSDDEWSEYGASGGSGSGLPEVEGSGKALVSVNGEWKIQDGYGYEIDTRVDISWDGDITGREHETCIQHPEEDPTFFYVSSDILNVNNVIGGTYLYGTWSDPYAITESDIVYDEDDPTGFMIRGDIYCIPQDNFIFSSTDVGYDHQYSFPKAGVYFSKHDGQDSYTKNLQCGTLTVQPIDEKYLTNVHQEFLTEEELEDIWNEVEEL